jgi:hypothetical protein
MAKKTVSEALETIAVSGVEQNIMQGVDVLLETMLMVVKKKTGGSTVVAIPLNEAHFIMEDMSEELGKMYSSPGEGRNTDDTTKELQVIFMKKILEFSKALAYAHIVEGWATPFPYLIRDGVRVRDLPPEDRNDIAFITVVENGKQPVGWSSIIDTQIDGSRTLRGWEKTEEFDGRFVIRKW